MEKRENELPIIERLSRPRALLVILLCWQQSTIVVVHSWLHGRSYTPGFSAKRDSNSGEMCRNYPDRLTGVWLEDVLHTAAHYCRTPTKYMERRCQGGAFVALQAD